MKQEVVTCQGRGRSMPTQRKLIWVTAMTMANKPMKTIMAIIAMIADTPAWLRISPALLFFIVATLAVG